VPHVSYVTVIDADLSSFDQLLYKQGLATYVGVPTQNVQLLVSQASVRVDARITPTATLTSVAIVQKLAHIQDAASATAHLSMPVESVAAPVIVPALNSSPPPQPGLDIGDDGDALSGEDGGLSGGGVAGLVIGLLLVLALVVFALVIFRIRRRKQQEQKDMWQPRFFPAADMSDVKSDTIQLMVDGNATTSGHPDVPYATSQASPGRAISSSPMSARLEGAITQPSAPSSLGINMGIKHYPSQQQLACVSAADVDLGLSTDVEKDPPSPPSSTPLDRARAASAQAAARTPDRTPSCMLDTCIPGTVADGAAASTGVAEGAADPWPPSVPPPLLPPPAPDKAELETWRLPDATPPSMGTQARWLQQMEIDATTPKGEKGWRPPPPPAIP